MLCFRSSIWQCWPEGRLQGREIRTGISIGRLLKNSLYGKGNKSINLGNDWFISGMYKHFWKTSNYLREKKLEVETGGDSCVEKAALKGWSVSFSGETEPAPGSFVRKELAINLLTLLFSLLSLVHLVPLSNLGGKGTGWCNPYRSASWGTESRVGKGRE